MVTAATSLSSQSVLLAQAGEGGGNRAQGKLLGPDTTCFSLLLVPFTSQQGLAGRGRAEAREQLEGGGWDRAPREGALRPRREGT